MSDDGCITFVVIAVTVCLGIVLLCVTTFTKGYERGSEKIMIEAVQRGYAEWTVSDDGETTFEWIEPTEQEEKTE